MQPYSLKKKKKQVLLVLFKCVRNPQRKNNNNEPSSKNKRIKTDTYFISLLPKTSDTAHLKM